MFVKRFARGSSWAVLLWALVSVPGASLAAGKQQSPKEAKVSVYISIINSQSQYVFKSYSSYTKQVADVNKGPTCNEIDPARLSPGSMSSSALDDYKSWKKALAKAPKLESDAAALDMVDALEQLYGPENEASEYYYQRKYKADACKRGIELHPLLMAGWTKYMKAEDTLRVFLDKYTDERDTAELVKTEKQYGKGLHYHQSKLMLQAKALVHLTDKPLDLATLKEQMALFEPLVTSAKELVAKEKKGKNAEGIYHGGYEQFVSAASQYGDTVKRLVNVLEEERADPKSAAKQPQRLQDSVKSSISAFNRLVDQSNKVMYTKAMK